MTDAPSPFNRPDADIILRSLDGVKFHVHKLILSVSSPFFDDMFSIPQPKASGESLLDDDTSLPIIPFVEDSVTLDILLRDCYPTQEHVFTDRGVLMKVLRAADKYQLDKTMRRLEQVYIHLCADEISKNPVEAYVLAYQRKWSNLSKVAVKASLLFTHDQIQAQFRSVDFTTLGRACLTFLEHHFKCCAATRDFLSKECLPCGVIGAARDMTETNGPCIILKHLELATAEYMGELSKRRGVPLDIPSKFQIAINCAVRESELGTPF
ncbi:hypothetical protein ONZ45_g10084 [Pleurotus djamor]|nr:hypothetical protein ONZ45_g10084 [Pleurotus djamor]